MASPYEILQRGGHLQRSRLWTTPLLVWPQELSEIGGQQLRFHGQLSPEFPNQIPREEALNE